MPPVSTAAVFDLTTVERVRSLVAVAEADVGSGLLQGLITAASRQLHQWTGRRTLNRILTLTDTLDGSGTDTEWTRDWPIKTVTSVLVNGVAVAVSPDGITGGWTIADDRRRLLMLAGTVAPGGWRTWPWGRHNIAIAYQAGYDSVSDPPANADYNGAPEDLGMAVTEYVAQQYKRRDWMDQASKTLAAGETITFRDWQWSPVVDSVVRSYSQRSLA